MDSRDLAAEQPMPTPNAAPSVQGMVIADLEVRLQVGIQRYGTALQPFNGRDALRDLYEELLDAACYIRQLIAERDALAEAGKGSASQAPGSPGRCGASAGVLTCALPRHGGDRHTSPEGVYWYGAGGHRG